MVAWLLPKAKCDLKYPHEERREFPSFLGEKGAYCGHRSMETRDRGVHRTKNIQEESHQEQLKKMVVFSP